jgi:ubiquinone/menaquinone biosynthesis C-methylase UbiE
MNKLAGLNSTKEIGDWYDNKYKEMGGAWNTPPEDCMFHIEKFLPFTTLPNGDDKSKLLDIGCGGGHFIAKAQVSTFDCTGIEASSVGLEECRKRVPEAKFYLDDIEKMGFVDGTFDIVTSIGTLEHVVNIPIAVSECFRVLKDGGVFYVYAPNTEWIHEDQPNEVRMDEPEWREILVSAGFKVEYTEKFRDNNIYICRK